MGKTNSSKVIKLENFASQSATTKSPIQLLIAHIARDVNRHKLNYDQLKFIFKSVRTRCELSPSSKSKKLYELPTKSEMAAFYAVIPNPVHRLIFEFLDGSGLRVAELCNLEVKRIDFDKNFIFVHEGKGRKDRVTVIGNHLLQKLALYLKGRNNKFLFESNRHTKYSPRRIEQLCKRFKDKAGIAKDKDLTPHTFRHRWNTRLAEGGISREGREILAGHSKGSATQDIYTHLAAGGVKNEVIAVLDSATKEI